MLIETEEASSAASSSTPTAGVEESQIGSLLATLFEPTPTLHSLLVPQVLAQLSQTQSQAQVPSASELIDISETLCDRWSWEDKARFLAGHPMIGEPKVSGLSGKEQAAGPTTPKVVLDRYVPINHSLLPAHNAPTSLLQYADSLRPQIAAVCGFSPSSNCCCMDSRKWKWNADWGYRLAHLNQLYCQVFPGLRYITFVNARPRADIIPEFETILGLPISPQPLPEGFATDQPPLDSPEAEAMVRPMDSDEWRAECQRGLGDIWRIGRARLKTLGLE